MQTIWKFELAITDTQTIKMPVGALMLRTVQIQNDIPVMWAVCNSAYKMEDCTIITLGTGNPISEDLENFEYVGTYQYSSFVGHVFAKKIK